jgi:hypothetical protein
MPALRVLLSLVAALCLGFQGLTAQAKADTSSDATPHLAGKWELTPANGAGPYWVTFQQKGDELRAEMTVDVLCAGRKIRMSITLEGEVDGSSVWLRPTAGHVLTGRIDSDLADRCAEYRLLRESADFRGQPSADGKRIVGPYDYSNNRNHTWIIRR